MTDATITLKGHDLLLTNLTKVLWPEDGYTKGDLLEYYQNIAPYILPFLKNRPMVMRRYPDGIYGENFFQKNISKELQTNWLTIEKIKHEEGRVVNYVLVQDEASLLFVVNLASIELHPFNAQVGHIQNPDYFVLDLDPNDISLNKVIEIAQTIREFLEKLGVHSYCKTSGSRGLHVEVPLGKQFDYDQSKAIARRIAELIHEEYPRETTLEVSKAAKRNKVYIDYLRNSWAQTVVAPYSVRPRPYAPVSTPLMWDEVKPGLDPAKFNIKTIFKRLDKIGEIFKPVLGRPQVKGLKKLL